MYGTAWQHNANAHLLSRLGERLMPRTTCSLTTETNLCLCGNLTYVLSPSVVLVVLDCSISGHNTVSPYVGGLISMLQSPQQDTGPKRMLTCRPVTIIKKGAWSKLNGCTRKHLTFSPGAARVERCLVICSSNMQMCITCSVHY